MTSSKISNILKTYYGISDSLNRWIKLPQISIIHLEQEANLYTDLDELYYFDSKDNSLSISKNSKYKNLENIESSYNAYPVHIKIASDRITGFISTVSMGPSGVYLNRPF